MTRLKTILNALGPGILLAGAAIGGSHLVASTQAGAHYGWSLLVMLLAVNLFKYPFFLYGQKYTAATGESLLDGYLRLGKGYLILFFLLNISTGIINIAGVSMITGSLATNFGLGNISVPILSGILIFLCVIFLIWGDYKLLDSFGKFIVLILAISTISALALSFFREKTVIDGFVGASPWTITSFGFIIVFMGWMPAPIDVSVWSSLWMKSQAKTTGKMASMKDAMIDFHVGYIATVVLAVVFLALGVIVMYGSGEVLSDKGSVFAKQLIEMYSISLGSWAKPIIIISAFAAMLSTMITTIDGYPRSLATTTKLSFPKIKISDRVMHSIWIIAGSLIGYLIISEFVDRLGDLLSIAMIISFLTAPIFAWLNYKVMCSATVPKEYHPKVGEKLLSISGIVFLSVFSIIFIYWYFFLV